MKNRTGKTRAAGLHVRLFFPAASLGAALRLVLRNDVILPELVGRHTHIFGELQIEIALRIIPHHLRNARDRQVGGDEQGLRLADAAAQQILHGGIPAHLLEHMG